MSLTKDASKYGPMAQALHWISAVAIIGALATIEAKGWFPKGSEVRDAMKAWHFQLGAAAFLLTCLRLGWRALRGAPPPLASASQFEALAARLGHAALYLCLLALPVLGLAILVVAGKPVALFGVPVAVMAEANEGLAHTLKEAHELFGNALIALIGLHVAAAFWHRWIRKDGVMARMLPGR